MRGTWKRGAADSCHAPQTDFIVSHGKGHSQTPNLLLKNTNNNFMLCLMGLAGETQVCYTTSQPNFRHMCQSRKQPKQFCHKIEQTQSPRSPPPPLLPPCVPPYTYLRCDKWRTGWCSGAGRCTGGSGKNISSSPVLADGWRALRRGLHIRTAAATVSQRRPGERRGRGERGCVDVRGAGGL